jgi:hypothetical protein
MYVMMTTMMMEPTIREFLRARKVAFLWDPRTESLMFRSVDTNHYWMRVDQWPYLASPQKLEAELTAELIEEFTVSVNG